MSTQDVDLAGTKTTLTTESEQDTSTTVSAEFILSKFLPSKFPSTSNSDHFHKLMTDTLQKNVKFYKKCVWRLQDEKKIEFQKIDLAECFSSHFGKHYESFMENVIQLACQVVKKTDYLVLPDELDIQTLHSFICKKKLFNKIDVSDAEISISFNPGRDILDRDQPSSDIVELASQNLCDIICTFAPADQDHVAHHPATIKLQTSDKNLASLFQPEMLKAQLERMNMKCDECNISFNDKQILGAGETRRANDKQIETQQAAEQRRVSPCDQSSSVDHDEPQATSREQQATSNAIPQNSLRGFTFDSLRGNQLLIDPPHIAHLNARLNTASRYWQLDAIHKEYSTGKKCTIAIIDDGIDPGHPAINVDNILDFQDFSVAEHAHGNPNSPSSHGTMCAGIACGKKFTFFPGQNLDEKSSTFPSGVAPDAEMLIYKVAYGIGPETDDQVCRALKSIWKRKGVDVVSLSLGSLQFVPKIAKMITELVLKDIIVVCAASNFGHRFSQPICFPARLGHVLCIGSHGPHGKPSDFSPVGQQIDFLAPGEDITAPASSDDDYITTDSGTSYATPAVAGLICLIIDYMKDRYSPDYFHNHWIMKEILREISTSPGRHSDDRGCGALNPIQFFLQPDCILKSIDIKSNLK